MSSTIFLIIALVTTGIFVIQFVLSIFFGDIDADVDVDADISSVVSFKGLTHFGIGFGWYMYLAGNTEIQSYVIGILVGLFFVLAVWFLYKKAYQLQQVNHSEQTDQLVGRECTIYFKQSDSKYTVQTTRDGAMREVDVISESGKTYHVCQYGDDRFGMYGIFYDLDAGIALVEGECIQGGHFDGYVCLGVGFCRE